MFFWSREGATPILTQRNAILTCICEYKWSWNVAEAHVQAVNVMYARQQVGVGRITRTRTENRPLLALDADLQELVESGMPQGDAVFQVEGGVRRRERRRQGQFSLVMSRGSC